MSGIDAKILLIEAEDFLRWLTQSTIVHGCVNGRPVRDPILPEPFQASALTLLAQIKEARRPIDNDPSCPIGNRKLEIGNAPGGAQ